MADKLTPGQDETLRAAFDAGLSCRVAASRAGCGVSAAVSRFRLWRKDAAPKDEPKPAVEPKVEIGGDGTRQTMTGLSPKMIYTEEEAVEFFKVDLTRWKISRWKAGMWQLGMKMNRGMDAEGRRIPDAYESHALCKVMIEMEPVAPKGVLDGLELVFKRYTSDAFRLPAPLVEPRRPGRTMLEINISDLHLGKLCWAQETGHDYDLKIAERVYRNAVADLLDRARGFDVDRIVMPIGSDYYHYDTPAGTTTGGTPLDRDGRLAKMFDIGVSLKIWAVAEMLKVCDAVDLKLVFGNHDGVLALCMARAVAERYHNDDRVTVDYGANVYKYSRYGINLIGYTHGNEVKAADLPMIMADQRRLDWCETECQEWHIGHFHTSRSLQTKSSDEFKGVEVIVVPSLCGTDAWHYIKGYLGNKRAARAFVYDKEHGRVATFDAKARS